MLGKEAANTNTIFLTKIIRIGKASINEPTTSDFEPPRHNNRSLKISIARFLQKYQPGLDRIGPIEQTSKEYY